MMGGAAEIREEIRALLDAPPRVTSRAAIEHALTAGYAHALALDAERWRLERRLAQRAASAGRPAQSELGALGRRLAEVNSELGQLRALLVALKARFEEARAAA